MPPRKTPLRRTRFEASKPGALATLPTVHRLSTGRIDTTIREGVQVDQADPGDGTFKPRHVTTAYRYGAQQIAALFKPLPKHEYVRSPALMKAYRMIACQMCGARDGTVCGAHSNWAIHGKAMSEKADDNRCASLCFKCHSELDQGIKFRLEEKRSMWWSAHVSTLVLLAKHRLWPHDVPFPDINHDPWSNDGRQTRM